jgi:maleate cis-trans isomerase
VKGVNAQDWRVRLEWVVAESLRKMRRTTREKRTMMKYLPGDSATSGYVCTSAS